jgi:hypothetical protein
LQLGVIGLLVERAPLERLAHDLADALGGEPLLLCDLVISPALAQAGEDAPSPHHPRQRGEPPLRGGNSLIFHICLAFEPRPAAA